MTQFHELRLTWVDFLVRGNSVSIHNVLKASSELVDLVVRGRGIVRLHPVQDGGHSGATALL